MNIFTNINVTDTALCDKVVCDELITNSFLINSTNFGVSGTGLFNNLNPYSGNIMTISGNATPLNLLDLNSSNIVCRGNIRTLGNIILSNNRDIFGDVEVIGQKIALKANGNNNGISIKPNSFNGAGNNFVTQINIRSANTTSTFSDDLGDVILRSSRGDPNNVAIGEGNLDIFCNNITLGRIRQTNNVNILSKTTNVNDLSASGNIDGNIISDSANITNLIVNTTGNINNLIALGNTVVNQRSLNKKIKFEYIEPSTSRINFYCNSNIIGENIDGFIECDTALTGNTQQLRGDLSLVTSGNIAIGLVNGFSTRILPSLCEIQGNINALRDCDVYGNLQTRGNLEINSDGNISNDLIIRSGFRGSTATNRFVTYNVQGNNGQHFFWDSVEVFENLLVNGTGNIVGNLRLSSANLTSTLNVVGNTNVTNLLYNDLYKDRIRVGDAFGPIFLAIPTIPTNNNVPFSAPTFGTLDGQDVANGWIRINKQGQSITVGVKLVLIFEINTGFTNSTQGQFQVQTSTTTAFGSPVSRTLCRVLGAFTSGQYVELNYDFIMPTTEEYFRVRYTGNASWSFVGGQANGFLSRYSIRTYL
jgi:hypothetical protein